MLWHRLRPLLLFTSFLILSKTLLSVKAKQPIAAPRPAAPVPKQTVSTKAPRNLLATKPEARANAESNPETSLAEMVCMLPQDVVFDEPPVSLESDQSVNDLAETEMVSIAAANNLRSPALQRIEDGLLASTTSSSQELIPAIPSYRSNPFPGYPYQARQKHWEGVVWLLVDVSADGSVDDLRVEQSCGHRVLDRTASRTVSRWQFSPATRAGLAVSSQVRIPVRFRLEDG